MRSANVYRARCRRDIAKLANYLFHYTELELWTMSTKHISVLCKRICDNQKLYSDHPSTRARWLAAVQATDIAEGRKPYQPRNP